MKGTPEYPECGFSAKAVKLLNKCNAEFTHVNVIENQELRSAIKIFSDWPTIPQLYINGDFIGGVDIMSDMYESGELLKMLDL